MPPECGAEERAPQFSDGPMAGWLLMQPFLPFPGGYLEPTKGPILILGQAPGNDTVAP